MKAVAVALCVAAQLAQAQDAPRTLVRLTVRDSLGAPVPDADVAVLRGLRDTVTTGKTDAAGARVLFVPRDGAPIQVVVRKIGFARADRFATTAGRDSVTIGITMKRLVTALAEVRITEKEDAVRKSYFIDADDIAKSARPILDAADVLVKMRPDMVTSRSPKPYGACDPISNIWVNGVLVYRSFPRVKAPAATRPRPGSSAGSGDDPNVMVSALAKSRADAGGLPGKIGAGRLTLLEEIKPEHIAEISYKDCFDTSIKGNFGQNALFIVLKPGIRYELNYGSYPMDAPRAARKP